MMMMIIDNANDDNNKDSDNNMNPLMIMIIMSTIVVIMAMVIRVMRIMSILPMMMLIKTTYCITFDTRCSYRRGTRYGAEGAYADPPAKWNAAASTHSTAATRTTSIATR